MYNWTQFSNLEKVKKMSIDDQKRAYYRYRNSLLEANSPSSAASSSAAGAGGGTLRRSNGSAAIYYRLTAGVFEYSVTNFDTGQTTGLKSRTYTSDLGINSTQETQDGGFQFIFNSDTDAKDYFVYIDTFGQVKEYSIDYSADYYTQNSGKYNVTYYNEGGKWTAIINDANDIRVLKSDDEFHNFFDWSFDSFFSNGIAFITRSGNIHKLNILKDGSTSPVKLIEIDTTTHEYSVYMFNFGENLYLTTRLIDEAYTHERIRAFDSNGTLVSEYDLRPYAFVEYTVQEGDTKESVAADQGCSVATLVSLNPEYDMDNLVDGDTINGFSPLFLADFCFMNNGNPIFLINNNGLSYYGSMNIVYHGGASSEFSGLRYLRSFTYRLFNGWTRSWDSTYNYLNDSVLLCIYTDAYDSSDDVGNFIVYADQTYLLPVFPSDAELRTPILFATQSDFLPLGSENQSWRSKGFFNDWNPRMDAERIDILVDENRHGPGLFHFTDYGMANEIDDGGLDLYDGGNLIGADGTQIFYTHTQQEEPFGVGADETVLRMGLPVPYFRMNGTVSTADCLGPDAQYFTNLYPGLFTFTSKNVNIDLFSTSGYTGHDSQGLTYSTSFQISATENIVDGSASNIYQAFVKCLYSETVSRMTDPSINQIIIVNAATSSGLSHIVAADTNDDIHGVSGLTGSATEVHYLLLTQLCDEKLTDAQMIEISQRYVNLIHGKTIEQARQSLNEGYETITGVVDKTTVKYSMLSINSDGTTTTKPVDIYKSEEVLYPEHGPRITKYKSTQDVQFFGPTPSQALPNMENRSWSNFYRASNTENNIVGTDMIMWSVRSNNYYRMTFTDWGTGFGAKAFAYTRQLITPSMDEPIISVTQSNFDTVVDVIEPGVLELTRKSFGKLMNVAIQSYDITVGPVGALFSSAYSGKAIRKSILIDSNNDCDIIEHVELDGISNSWRDSFFVLDFIYGKTYYSNDATDNKWQSIDEYYDEQVSPYNYVSNSAYNQSTSIIENNLSDTARILSVNGISGTFSYLMEPGSTFSNRTTEVNDEFAVYVYGDGSGIWVVYRDTDGDVVDSVKIDDTDFDNYWVRHSKNRYFVTYYDYDMNYEVLHFDGKTIKKILSVPDEGEGFENMINDLLD